MTKLEIIELIALAIIAVGIGIYYLVKAIKNNWLGQLTETIEQAIKEAEKSGADGKEKKAMVIIAVEKKCKELGIPFETIRKLVSKLIDKIIHDYNVIEKGK